MPGVACLPRIKQHRARRRLQRGDRIGGEAGAFEMGQQKRFCRRIVGEKRVVVMAGIELDHQIARGPADPPEAIGAPAGERPGGIGLRDIA